MNSMAYEYFKESQHYETIEIPEKGFLMYAHAGEELHLAHMYVRPQFRKEGLAQKLASMACDKGKELGCKYAACMVTLSDKTPEVSTRLVRIYAEFGFTIWQVNTGFNVIMKKDLI